MEAAETFRDVILARVGDAKTAILFEDESWSYAEFVQACAERAALLLEMRREGPLHVGVLLDNVPEFPFWIGAAALVGATIVGINPTRRGAELARDILHADCQLIVTEGRHLGLLNGLDLGDLTERILDIDGDAYADRIAGHGAAPVPDAAVEPGDQLLLLFTSGTSGAPKAVICSHGKMVSVGRNMVMHAGLHRDSIGYLVMPLFHSNGLFTGLSPLLTAGAAIALRRKFSASGFLPDVRRFRATYFNYVGKPLSYILATPELPDDGDNTLECVFGNEGADLDLERFSKRFDVLVRDSYGSTETGATIGRVEGMPKGALGVAVEGIVVMDPETGRECPRAVFDAAGRLLNAEQAIGEIVNTQGPALFEGYYKNDEANATRMRDGIYWSGDLAYRDADGYFYFAGRDFDWLRVDGENFAAAPVERILSRYEGVVLAVVYAVPDSEVGDQVMAALQLVDPGRFDPEGFRRFLAEQDDLGTKASPRYVRVAAELPITETSKVMKRKLRAERWECGDTVYFRPEKGDVYRVMTPEDVEALRVEFEARDRLSLLI